MDHSYGQSQRSRMGLALMGGVGTLALLTGLTVALGSWYTVDQTERGVLLRNGAVIGTAQPGLGFKLPLVDGVEKISVRTSTWTWDKMNSYSYDQQPADLKISVTFRAAPDKVAELYAKFGTIDAAIKQVVSPIVNQQVKIVFGRYTAVRSIQERGGLNEDIRKAITETLKDDSMIMIESVQIENIEFSHAYLQSIEQRMLAEVEVQRLQQNAEREKVQAQIVVTKATAEANAARQAAQGAADALRFRADAEAAQIKARGEAEANIVKVKGDAEASAIQARGKALGDNPHLVTLVQAERWDGKLPTSMIPGGAVPMIGLGGVRP